MFLRSPLHYRDFKLAVALLLACLFPGSLWAAYYIPLSLNGDVGYSYGYVTSESAESETTAVAVSLNNTGYIWQPWFINTDFGLVLGLTRSASSSNEDTTSTAIGGRMSFDVFSRSRFPYSLTISRTDSSLDANSEVFVSASSRTVLSRIFMHQGYVGRRNFLADLFWSHSKISSTLQETTSDTINGSAIKREPGQIWTAKLGYTTSKNKNSVIKPQNVNLSLNHNYVPDTGLRLNSTFGVLGSSIKGGMTDSLSSTTQVSSSFSLTPSHKPYSISGGVRLASSRRDISNATTDTNDFNVSLGTTYNFSTKLRGTGSIAANVSDTEGSQNSSYSGLANLGYSSDRYYLAGFDYGWTLNGGLGYIVREDDSSIDQQGDELEGGKVSASVSVSHRASNSWNLGRSANMNLSLSQAGAVNADSEEQTNANLSHGANSTFGFRDKSGTTLLSVSVSDSRSASSNNNQGTGADGALTYTSSQSLNSHLSRNQFINRLSSVNGSVSYQLLGQDIESGGNLTSSSLTAAATYNHSRVFGVFALNLESRISYSSSDSGGNGGVTDTETKQWFNRFKYRLGLLDSSLTIRISSVSGGNAISSMIFRATRRF